MEYRTALQQCEPRLVSCFDACDGLGGERGLCFRGDGGYVMEGGWDKEGREGGEMEEERGEAG